MHDGTQMEKRGIPTAVICTEAFTTVAESMAEVQGLPNYDYAVIPHPLASLTDTEVEERARFILPKIVSLLTSQSSPEED